MLKGQFKLVGLSRKKSMTCEPLNDEGNFFWPKVGIDQDRFDALWNFMTGRWGDTHLLVVIEYEKITDDGIPINGTVIETIVNELV